MAVNDVLGQLQLLLKKSTPLIESGDQGSEELLKFTPGQQVQAKVLGALPGGRFLVLVDDRQLDLNLPRNTQPGDNVELRFVGNQPRPTFMLANEAATPSGRAPVTLSDTARFIGALLNKANSLAAQEGAPLTRGAPVLAGPPADVQQFAVALRSALSQSGLFYESHQAQWASGQRSLGELLKEPQAQLSEPRAFATAQRLSEAAAQNSAPQAGDSRTPVAKGAPETAFPNPLNQVATANHPQEAGRAASAQQTAAAGMRDQAAPEPVHPSAAPMVQQQLDALDTRQIVWQGQVWPGQAMHWEIEERDAREGGQTEQSEWQTRLNLTLPNLGEVGAQLKLSAQGIRIEVTAAETDTLNRLQQSVAALKAGFDRANLNLAQVLVKPYG